MDSYKTLYLQDNFFHPSYPRCPLHHSNIRPPVYTCAAECVPVRINIPCGGQLGDATDPTALFDRAKNRKVSKKRPDTADRSSDLARLLVRDPQV